MFNLLPYQSTMRTQLCFSLSCLVLLLAASTGLAEKQTTAEPPVTVNVHVQTLQKNTSQQQVELVATIQPVLQAAIAAKVTGTITQLPVQLGSKVKQGDLLIKINAEEISARLMQAQAQLAQARRNYEREKKLLKKNATTRETVKSLRDMLNVAQAAFHGAKTMLGYTTITAPFDGVVTNKSANSGDLATPGTPLLHIENNTHLQAVTAVPESLINQIHPADTIQVHIPSAQLALIGTVAEIAPAADPQSRTAQVKIDIPYEQALRSGQFARVNLPVQPATTLLVPRSAVVPFGQMDKVFVVEDGIAQLRLVRTGSSSGDTLEILAGLRPGDQVIIDNNALLVSGQPVHIE